MVWLFNASSVKVHCVKWSRDGSRIASGSTDRMAKVYTLDEHGSVKKIMDLHGHSSHIDALAWDPTNGSDKLITVSSDKTLRLWDARTGKAVMKKETSGENLNVSWKRDGLEVVYGNKSDVVSVLDLRSDKLLFEHKFPEEVPFALSVTCFKSRLMNYVGILLGILYSFHLVLVP